ncbi:MAG: two-component system response regulator, partial [Armatimonadetes bacterium]|nr:two-component system response regulator [Armatimonadota bacterium]
HHEMWDGNGYPLRLKGEEIPLGARLFAVADCLDAMTSNRPYRAALPFSVAQEEVKRFSGKQFDPDIVDLFLRVPIERWHYIRSLVLEHEE